MHATIHAFNAGEIRWVFCPVALTSRFVGDVACGLFRVDGDDFFVNGLHSGTMVDPSSERIKVNKSPTRGWGGVRSGREGSFLEKAALLGAFVGDADQVVDTSGGEELRDALLDVLHGFSPEIARSGFGLAAIEAVGVDLVLDVGEQDDVRIRCERDAHVFHDDPARRDDGSVTVRVEVVDDQRDVSRCHPVEALTESDHAFGVVRFAEAARARGYFLDVLGVPRHERSQIASSLEIEVRERYPDAIEDLRLGQVVTGDPRHHAVRTMQLELIEIGFDAEHDEVDVVSVDDAELVGEPPGVRLSGLGVVLPAGTAQVLVAARVVKADEDGDPSQLAAVEPSSCTLCERGHALHERRPGGAEGSTDGSEGSDPSERGARHR